MLRDVLGESRSFVTDSTRWSAESHEDGTAAPKTAEFQSITEPDHPHE